MKVFINPGHASGGIPDPGAVNPVTGTKESDIAAQAGRLLANYLVAAGIERRSSLTTWARCALRLMSGVLMYLFHCIAMHSTALLAARKRYTKALMVSVWPASFSLR